MAHVAGAAPARRRSDLMTRALTGGAMIAIAVAALWLGGMAFWLLASAAALLMLAEWAGLMRAARLRIGVALAALGFVLVIASPMAGGVGEQALALLAALALAVAALGRSARLGAGLVYVGLPTFGLLFLRGQPHGLALTLWTLAIVWATDIGAYFSGRAIGGPKLAPALSPNKTWAGLLGGALAAAIVGALIAWSTGLPAALLLLGAPMAVLAQIGDLFESWMKRKAGVKDSGRLLPGHGGALDRLDGVVPVATLIGLLAATGVV
ncbi:phosphatidate cytidylyltransferase [Sphingomonas profundi]|uniref:phosphatidate cytidylyltransferase n=1 Tax=Alterirhizorhabdus profundi TaxID=2681549 RepID=UPI0012E83A6F|nr:phosphatidate cytidylyltransferase [Sphingomonas profundi]